MKVFAVIRSRKPLTAPDSPVDYCGFSSNHKRCSHFQAVARTKISLATGTSTRGWQSSARNHLKYASIFNCASSSAFTSSTSCSYCTSVSSQALLLASSCFSSWSFWFPSHCLPCPQAIQLPVLPVLCPKKDRDRDIESKDQDRDRARKKDNTKKETMTETETETRKTNHLPHWSLVTFASLEHPLNCLMTNGCCYNYCRFHLLLETFIAMANQI